MAIFSNVFPFTCIEKSTIAAQCIEIQCLVCAHSFNKNSIKLLKEIVRQQFLMLRNLKIVFLFNYYCYT